MCTKPAENIIKQTGRNTQAVNWAIGFMDRSLYSHNLPVIKIDDTWKKSDYFSGCIDKK